MSMNKQFQAYQNNAVNTASGGELTLMLYNGSIRFIKQAIRDMKKDDFENKNLHIQKAQTIIQELMLTLDPKIELSAQIMPLYDYILHLLREGNMKNEAVHLEEALQFVIELRDTWKEVILKTKQTKYVQGAQV